MTREEYNTRTNANASVSEYETIERIYMAAGDNIDKDQFCNDIKRCGATPTLLHLTSAIENYNAKVLQLTDELDHLAFFIAAQAEECLSSELRRKAIEMMGAKDYITWKIGNKIDLWDEDLELIHDLINA